MTEEKKSKFLDDLDAIFMNPPKTEPTKDEKVNGKMIVLDNDATPEEVKAYLGGPRI